MQCKGTILRLCFYVLVRYSLLFSSEILLTQLFTSGSVNIVDYYMASSESGQDEPNRVMHVIGYPSGQDGAILPDQDYPLYPERKFSPKAI